MASGAEQGMHDLVGAMGRLGVHDHLCLIYETQEEQFSAVMPFMRMGLERGERCIYVVDDNTAATVLGGMEAAGVDVESAIESGRLAVVSSRDSYLKQGYFDPDWMIDFLEKATGDAISDGFSALRVAGEMTWMLGGALGSERLVEYEARLNCFFPRHRSLAMCQYNRRRFPAAILRDVISTHPLVVCGGMVCSNFYYIPPDEFLDVEQAGRQVDRLLSNIVNRNRMERELQRYREDCEEQVKERADELKRMNERFTLATNAARLGVWDWDLQRNELFWDDRMYDLYGMRREDFTGAYEAWLQGVHPDDRARCDEVSRLARNGDLEYDTEFRVVWPDGSVHWLEAHGQIVRDADGTPSRMTGVNFDISKRKQAEEALNLLNEELERRVRERTRELERRNRELEQMNKAFVGRELRMAELKEKNAAMERKLAQQDRTS